MYKYFVLACMLLLLLAGAFYAGHKFSLARLGLDVLEGLTVGLPDREQKEFESKVKPLDANLAHLEHHLSALEKNNADLQRQLTEQSTDVEEQDTATVQQETTQVESEVEAQPQAERQVTTLVQDTSKEVTALHVNLATSTKLNSGLREEISSLQQVNSLLKKENSLFRDRVNQLIGRRLRHGPGAVIGYDPFRGNFTISIGWAISWS